VREAAPATSPRRASRIPFAVEQIASLELDLDTRPT